MNWIDSFLVDLRWCLTGSAGCETLLREREADMEKHGVCDGEGVAPEKGQPPKAKTGADTGNSGTEPQCGADMMSKAAEAAARPPRSGPRPSK